jgi:hypothetical protein
MSYRYCKQCKKRLGNSFSGSFCNSECKIIYNNSSDVFCKNCNKLLGRSSVVKKTFCDIKCHNVYQKNTNLVERSCIFCEKSFIVQKSSHKYKLCSPECEKNYAASNIRNEKRMKSLTENNMEKYGVKYTSQLENFSEKVKKTKFKKYGNENYNNRILAKETCLKKYNTYNPMQSDKIINKTLSTKLLKYGTLNVNEKSNKTKLEKYGTLDFSDKARNTTLEKYGTLDFSHKRTSTIIKNFGSYHNCFIKVGFRKLYKKYQPFVNFLFNESEYSGSQEYKKYEFQCKICNTKFEDTMCNGKKPRCPICYPIPVSKPQQEVIDYIKSIFSGEILENNRITLSGLELDIYIPLKNLAIEFNGLYWHSEVAGGKNKYYHLNKTLECKKINIKLIHIFGDEWNYKPEIVKSKLKHLLMCDKEKVYARKCEIKIINYNTSADFLKSHHLQGDDRSSLQLGAYYKEELVAVMTFGKLRLALGNKTTTNNVYEMYRFCTSKSVVGIGSKLLTYFIKTYNPDKIISYADRRWSDENSFYPKIGFKLVGNTPSNYWYFNSNNVRHHRFNFRKDQLSKKLKTFDPKLSEWQNMQLNGYDRIWDCGHYKYEWIKP